jgi:murein DD-endopeptidase MepM/ murein hydrolase activator NlpD
MNVAIVCVLAQDALASSLAPKMVPSANTGVVSLAFPLAKKSAVSSEFGFRTDPLTRQYQRHTGIDLPANFGSPIRAVSDGTVIFKGFLPSYGNLVEIDHGNGYTSRYGHTNEILVNVGEIVKPAQMIATVGTTGRTTGPHLHFEVSFNRQPIDPRPFLGGERLDSLALNAPRFIPGTQPQILHHLPKPIDRNYAKPDSAALTSKTKVRPNSDNEIKPRIIYITKR